MRIYNFSQVKLYNLMQYAVAVKIRVRKGNIARF